jgi:PAS domain S-box-containing protein
MAAPKSSFLDKVLGRIGRLDAEGLQTVVQRLARERRFLETLFNIIEDGVLVADEQGRIIYFNQAVTRLVGLQPGVEGQHIADLLPELDWEEISKADHAGGERVVRHEFEVQYPRPRFLRLYAAPLDGEAAGSSGVALILHDATEARQKTYEAIESERVQALTLLAASVAHEIGNPLNALHIHLQLMERELRKLKGDEWQVAGLRSEASAVAAAMADRPARQASGGKDASPVTRHPSHREVSRKLEQYLDVAKGEIGRLDYIITQFLQAIRPAPLQLRIASLNEVVAKTLELLQPELDNRGLTIRTRLARQLTATLIDATQIQQVLVNLVKNAMHAMTKGGTLTLQTGEGEDGVWVSVTDTGGGIPPEQINRIFEPFYTTKKRGTGLGLMIVQRIVRAHGGRIELESHVGRGTTFRIWLPLHERRPKLLEARTGNF